MHPFEALVLGLVEGVTEYLPISSTGHLVLTQRLLGIENSAASRAFAVSIQSGAILAVLAVFWPRVRQMIAGLAGRDALGLRLCFLILAAFVPAAVLGLLFKRTIEDVLFGLGPIAIAWFVGGAAILVSARLRSGRREGTALADMRWTSALAIGACQALALAPGTSRSLVTIAGALFLGLSGAAAVEFSLLLGVVTLLAATAHEVHEAGGLMLDEYGATSLALGFAAAFVSAFLAVRWLVAWLSARGLFVFGVYRVALALVVALALALGFLPRA